MRWIRPLFFSAIFLALGATLIFAAETLSVWVSPGTTDIEFAGVTVRVETNADVIVYLSASDGQVVGQVSTAPGVRSATVTISVVEDPSRVIFDGRVVAPVWFADYLPQETGRGEQ
jgi:hypothetical protein